MTDNQHNGTGDQWRAYKSDQDLRAALSETVDIVGLVSAAKAALDTLSNMTTDAFAKGADREIRRDLARALGLDPADYSL